eukprot:m.348699 g.348699  ORF g.348699 m.348699 type:complete len:85 (+) comp38561_c0_seq1:1212-1466(+)
MGCRGASISISGLIVPGRRGGEGNLSGKLLEFEVFATPSKTSTTNRFVILFYEKEKSSKHKGKQQKLNNDSTSRDNNNSATTIE